MGFIQSLPHAKGRQWAGKPFELLKWEDDLIRPVFGKLRPDGTRKVRTVYCEVPRKNGKSELAAAVGLKMLFADQEPGAEVYGAATTREQAGLVFEVMAEMVHRTPALDKRCQVINHSKRILITQGPGRGSFYRAIAAEAPASHGFNASAVIFDEIHTQPSRDLWDVLTTATAARVQPLVFGITTAGFDRNSLCWDLHEYARQVIEGVIEDESWEAVIYGASETDDWTVEETWKKANPSYGITVNADYFESQVRQAKQSPSDENKFKRLHLNIWTAAESRYIPMADWDKCVGSIDEDALRRETCYAGLDLSSTTDLTALALVFPPENKDTGKYRAVMRFWCPEERIRQRSSRDRVDYQAWEDKGWIEATEGNVVDYAAVEREIGILADDYRLPMVAVDRLFNAEYLAQRVDASGIEVERKGQTHLDLSFPTKELLKLVLGHRLEHGGNPILRWMADNLMVEQDASGNVKPSKAKSTQRIDGMVALIMALDLALRHTRKPNLMNTVW